MKKIILVFILLFNLITENHTFSQEKVITTSNLSIGLSNTLFSYNTKIYTTVNPTVEFRLKHFHILLQYERFREFDVEDISNVRDGQPRVISTKYTYQHIPLSLKYCFIDKQKIDYYLKISGINQFRRNITSVYTYNNSAKINKQNNHNLLYGFSAGFDFSVCKNNKIGLEAYFKNGKNLYSEIFGLNLIYMYRLNIRIKG